MMCSGPECDRPAKATGLCAGHLQQRYRGRALSPLRARREPAAVTVSVLDSLWVLGTTDIDTLAARARTHRDTVRRIRVAHPDWFAVSEAVRGWGITTEPATWTLTAAGVAALNDLLDQESHMEAING